MSVSQFKIYSSSDPGAPVLNGSTGSLIRVLDWCLITGSGWLKPISSNSVSASCYQQPSGSGLVYYVNDSADGIYGAMIAMVCGWEGIDNITPPTGSGTGQFPTGLGYYIRKSNVRDSTPRYWRLYADSYTVYYFIWNGDSVGNTSNYCFGDIYSVKSTNDAYKCFINGRMSGAGDTFNTPNSDPTGWAQSNLYNTYNLGVMARGFGGGGTFIRVNRNVFGILHPNDIGFSQLYGDTPVSNPVDNCIYMSPLWIIETSNSVLRGRNRGLWCILHPYDNFSDGQILQGANELLGKTFQVCYRSYSGGFWAVEISNTVETNDV